MTATILGPKIYYTDVSSYMLLDLLIKALFCTSLMTVCMLHWYF